jgi:hypothetical protein
VLSSPCSEQDEDAAQVDKAQEIVGLALIADDQAPEVAEPGKEALDLPAPPEATQGAAILRLRADPAAAMGCNHLDPELGQIGI